MHMKTALGEHQGEKLEDARCKWMFHDESFNCVIIRSLRPNLCPDDFLLPCAGWSCGRDDSVKASAFQRALWHLWKPQGVQRARLRSTAEDESLWVKSAGDRRFIQPKLLLMIPDIY